MLFKKVRQRLDTFKDKDLIILYLLGLYYKLNIKIPDNLKKPIGYYYNFENKVFIYPIFDKQREEEWIEEYRNLFLEKNKHKKGNKFQIKKRLKWFFEEFPEYDKDIVIKATKKYLEVTNPTYIREPHYFIKKGRGSDFTSDLLTWIEIVSEEKEESINLKIK